MPIVVPCTGCPTKLSAPESAAGKQIRCPKCKAVVPVPALLAAEEVPVVEAKAAPPKPKPKPVVAEPDDEDEKPAKKARRDEEDDEDRPRKKKRPAYRDDDDDDEPPRRRKRKAGGGGNGLVVAGLVGGGLVLLLVCGGGLYWMFGKGGPLARKAPLPPGWKQFSYPNDGFKAAFPSEPLLTTSVGFGGQFGPRFQAGAELQEIESMSVYNCGDVTRAEGTHIAVSVTRFRNSVPRSIRDQIGRAQSAKFGDIEVRSVRWLGYDAQETVMGGMLMRIVYTDKSMIIVQVTGPRGQRAKPEEEAAFFDHFELTK